MRHAPMVRTGRNANGFSRDSGQRIHAVPLSDSETELPDGSGRKALCGAQPQGAAYWGEPWSSREVNCPRCVKKLASLSPHIAEPSARAPLLTPDVCRSADVQRCA